jgi:hypothetical protein
VWRILIKGEASPLRCSFRALSITSSQHSDQQNAKYFSLAVYITLAHNIDTCFDIQGLIIGELTKEILHETELATSADSRRFVKESTAKTQTVLCSTCV